jgi:hypothetical protein
VRPQAKAPVVAAQRGKAALGEIHDRIPHQRSVAEHPGVGVRPDFGEQGIDRGIEFRVRQHAMRQPRAAVQGAVKVGFEVGAAELGH